MERVSHRGYPVATLAKIPAAAGKHLEVRSQLESWTAYQSSRALSILSEAPADFRSADLSSSDARNSGNQGARDTHPGKKIQPGKALCSAGCRSPCASRVPSSASICTKRSESYGRRDDDGRADGPTAKGDVGEEPTRVPGRVATQGLLLPDAHGHQIPEVGLCRGSTGSAGGRAHSPRRGGGVHSPRPLYSHYQRSGAPAREGHRLPDSPRRRASGARDRRRAVDRCSLLLRRMSGAPKGARRQGA